MIWVQETFFPFLDDRHKFNHTQRNTTLETSNQLAKWTIWEVALAQQVQLEILMQTEVFLKTFRNKTWT